MFYYYTLQTQMLNINILCIRLICHSASLSCLSYWHRFKDWKASVIYAWAW